MKSVAWLGVVVVAVLVFAQTSWAQETATAKLSLLSTGGTVGSPVYNYDILLNDTGTTTVGTFWFGWVPGKDFMTSSPTSVTDPTGWTDLITHDGPTDGYAIQWKAGTGAAILAGHSLDGFEFSSPDSPGSIGGFSTAYPGTPTATAFIYSGAPFSDAGDEFIVATAVPEPSAAWASLGMLATLGIFAGMRYRGRRVALDQLGKLDEVQTVFSCTKR